MSIYSTIIDYVISHRNFSGTVFMLILSKPCNLPLIKIDVWGDGYRYRRRGKAAFITPLQKLNNTLYIGMAMHMETIYESIHLFLSKHASNVEFKIEHLPEIGGKK